MLIWGCLPDKQLNQTQYHLISPTFKCIPKLLKLSLNQIDGYGRLGDGDIVIGTGGKERMRKIIARIPKKTRFFPTGCSSCRVGGCRSLVSR